MNFPSSEALDSIYSKILAFHLQQHPFSPGVLKMADAVVSASIWLHHRVVHNFLPTGVKFHYIFNLRDLSNIFQVRFATQIESLIMQEAAITLFLWLILQFHGLFLPINLIQSIGTGLWCSLSCAVSLSVLYVALFVLHISRVIYKMYAQVVHWHDCIYFLSSLRL